MQTGKNNECDSVASPCLETRTRSKAWRFSPMTGSKARSRSVVALNSLVLCLLLGACSDTAAPSSENEREPDPAVEAVTETEALPETEATVVLASEVEWTPLNAARGDASPMAATVWGDRAGTQPTGFLFHPADGFSSPPHIHNVTYRGVVIRGEIHNDDPSAAEMWMPAGSFWTQPKGEPHITSARGDDVLAYIEIDRGPYLVWPVDQSFESDERPVNVDASNIVWVDA